MNVERLKELTKLLSTIPETNFDLDAWSGGENLIGVEQQNLIECGTVCCAVGWACSHPPFIEQGLHWGKYDYPTYEEYSSWNAVVAFFDIPREIAEYLFLDEFKNKISIHKKKIEYFEKDFGYIDAKERKFERQNLMENESKLDLNIYIWGHSLDVSDKDYIIDIFSLNDEIDRNVKVIVYYFDKNAKFSLLNNLLAILGKDKVEVWMKKRWLKFEPNPNIVEIDAI